MALVAARRNAQVGLARLAGTIYDTAHDSDLKRPRTRLEGLLDTPGDVDHVDLSTTARRAGNEVEALALAQSERLQQLASGACLLHRVGGQRVADGVADALGEKGPDTSSALDEPRRRRPRLGDAEVERVIEGLRRQPVGLDHDWDGGGLDGDLHIVEADLFEIRQLHPRRLDERLRCGAAVLLVKLGVQRAGVDSDSDRNTPVTGFGRDELDLLGLAQVARVESQPLHSRLQGGECHLVMEVHVGHDRDRRARDYLRQCFGRLLLVAGAAHDIGARGRERVDLGEGCLSVGRLRHGHRLDRDGRTTADCDLADIDLTSLAPFGHGCRGSGHHWQPSGAAPAKTSSPR